MGMAITVIIICHDIYLYLVNKVELTIGCVPCKIEISIICVTELKYTCL